MAIVIKKPTLLDRYKQEFPKGTHVEIYGNAMPLGKFGIVLDIGEDENKRPVAEILFKGKTIEYVFPHELKEVSEDRIKNQFVELMKEYFDKVMDLLD